MSKMFFAYKSYEECFDDSELKGKLAKPVKKVRKWNQYVPMVKSVVEKPAKEKPIRPKPVVDVSSGLCPCGCGQEVPNGCFYAEKKKCGKRANKMGIFMPRGGEWRSTSRVVRKLNLLKKGRT